MSVYGNMLSAFPELMRTIEVWSAPNEGTEKQNVHNIRAVYLPTRGDRLEYQKYSNRGRAIQYFEDDHLFVPYTYHSQVQIGDFFKEPDSGYIHRIVGEMPLTYVGGYACFTTERVTGTTIEQQEDLVIKEPEFA